MNKTVKVFAITLGTLAAICVLLVAAGMYLYHFHFQIGPSDPPLGAVERQVQQSLDEALSKGTTEIWLAQIADFPWEQVCGMQIYADEQSLNKAAGKRLRGYSAIGWIANRSYWTLAFIAGNEIKPVRVHVGRFGRYDSGGEFVECTPRASALLTYRAQQTKGIPPRDFHFPGRQR